MGEVTSFKRFNAELSIVYDALASKALDRDLWRVTESFRYYVNDKDSSVWVDVPAGYLLDGASVPQMFWNIVPPWGAYGQAAAVHDYLCEYLTVQTTEGPQRITRKRTDQIFEEAMRVLGVEEAKIEIMYGAVSLYRGISGTDSPTLDKQKLLLEVSWRNANSKPVVAPAAAVPATTVTASTAEVKELLVEKVEVVKVQRNVLADARAALTMDWIIRDKIDVEADYVDNPNDRGGKTNKGITEAVARVYEATLKAKFGWNGDMRTLSTDMAMYIYKADYWDKLSLDKIHAIEPLLADKLFDIGINCGIGSAAKWLQTILTVLNLQGKLYPDLVVDGSLGAGTITALNSYIKARGEKLALWTVLKALLCKQGDHYIDISVSRAQNETFTQGWLNRLDHNLMFYAALFK